MASKKKLLTSAIALTTAAALTLGGTFAWQSISQKALNEGSDQINPGGRLHDDFDGSNKDIYVENFAEDEIFARVRLSECFQIIMNYGGGEAEVVENVLGSREKNGEEYDLTFVPYSFADKKTGDGTYKAAVDKNGDAFWTWTVGGKTTYMPTFNKNKDSLAADINGIYEEGNVGVISNRNDPDDPQYTQYTNWSMYQDAEGNEGVGAKKTAWAIYDGDSNSVEELNAAETRDIIANGKDADSYKNFTDPDHDIDYYIEVLSEDHTVAETDSAQLISMTDWLTMVEGDGGYDKTKHGGYWVYDDSENGDSWVYWSAPIEEGKTTGCLLNGIELNRVMDDTWYYAIDVQGQFITGDDVGKDENSGFYADGERVSESAEKLLKAIGVEFAADEDVSTGGGTEPR